MPLLRILGVAFGLAVVLGTSIGAGILRTPGPVAALAGGGSTAVLLWVAGGLFALLGASALADLATSIPKSGGFYVFARRALGDGFGFTIGNADWFCNCTFVAYGALTVGEYVAMLVPAAAGYITAVAAAVIVLFAALQMLGMRVSSRLQEVTSFIKAIAFIVLIAGILLFAEPVVASAAPTAVRAMPTFVGYVLALQLVLGAYDGWQSATYFAGEDRDPERNLPRSLIGGVLVVMTVYVLMNIALVRVLPADTLATSTLPAADAAQRLLGDRAGLVITFLSVLSPFTLVSGVLLCAPRILYAMAADGLVSRRVSFVNAGGTPVVALILSTVASLLMLISPSFEFIATVGAFFAVASYSGGFIALLVLRAREPELPRPFPSWGHPWTTLLVLIVSLALMGGTIAGAPRESLVAIAALVVAYPVFRLTRQVV
jgi:basic amino acid/polyamine antiporter, APA family